MGGLHRHDGYPSACKEIQLVHRGIGMRVERSVLLGVVAQILDPIQIVAGHLNQVPAAIPHFVSSAGLGTRSGHALKVMPWPPFVARNNEAWGTTLSSETVSERWASGAQQRL
ncbi:hypothetical protein B0T14DRAFT_22602 [Immersiella caudata]|uniref:Uncharacterized protein n=1 Tax=Immersiella caudata TaxID=314043 RepID=A0AA40CC67_9PEZI|nr:hypothetical protein B0T14DRAFT_22602 [Immersiella caudata]